MGIFTCKGCANRTQNCHSTCEKYKLECEEHNRLKQSSDEDSEYLKYAKNSVAKTTTRFAKDKRGRRMVSSGNKCRWTNV